MLNLILESMLYEMAAAKRKKIKPEDFVFPEEKSWPIQSKKQAKIALIWATWPQHRKRRARVVKAVILRYPELKGFGAAKSVK